MATVIAFPSESKPVQHASIFTQIEQAGLVVTLAEYGMTHGYDALFNVVTAGFERFHRETKLAEMAGMDRESCDRIWADLEGQL